jgi:hypothetical protein
VLVCTLIAHLLAIAAFAASPQLHEWIHHDAEHEDYECAITLFASGACDSAFSTPIVVGIIGFELIEAHPTTCDYVPSCYLAHAILEHAPPANS